MSTEPKNPCRCIADYYAKSIRSAHLQTGMSGGVVYAATVKSGGSEYQISCKNTAWTLGTSVRIENRMAGSGFANVWNRQFKMDQETGVIELVDIFGNQTSIKLPIPDKMDKPVEEN